MNSFVKKNKNIMLVRELIDFFESIAPSSFQESYDNVGLITGSPNIEISGIITCLDATEAVIDEAITLNCNVVVAHHPIVFRGIKKLNGTNYVERVVIKAIKHDIAIFAIHTNLDNVYDHGVNTIIANRLNLNNLEILDPKQNLLHSNKKVGSGMIGKLKYPMEESAFLQYLKEKMDLKVVKHTALLGKPIENVAVCGGSGSFLLQRAIEQNADVFVTSDFKYHEFFDAENKIIIADIGHYESERFTFEYLKSLIIQNFSIFAVHSTSVNTNPVLYS